MIDNDEEIAFNRDHSTAKNAEPSWTDRLPSSPHVRFFKNTNWKATSLGPLNSWGPSLKFAANMVFNDSRPAAVYWGPEITGFYNEKFITLADTAHPILMGNSFWIGFPSAWADTKPFFDQAYKEGKCVEFEKIELLLSRGQKFLEESYFVGQIIPLTGDSGEIEGVYNSGYESTAGVLHERRRTLLNKLAALPTSDLPQLFRNITEVLETNGRDIPMALIYSADQESSPGKCIVTLRSSIAVPEGHPCAPSEAVLGDSIEGFIPLLQQARISEAPLMLSENDQTWEVKVGHLLEGIDWRGWGDRCRDLTISPLLNASQLIGFLIMATNPRRAYDETTRHFVTDISQQITSRCASTITIEKSVQREQRLIRDLALKEQRIRHMAQHAPVGMVQLSTDGYVEWGNDQWYDLTGHQRNNSLAKSWMDMYTESSQEEAENQWKMSLAGEITSCELQLRRLFHPPVPDDVEHHYWVTTQGFPLVENGEVASIMGTLTNVSHLKWAESIQARSALQASEAKRRQEEFIDMTSHELRNPLSAMYQCASLIAGSLQSLEGSIEELLETLQSNIDAANTILICADHQKRIVDDVLILNRLESMMLSITPVSVRLSDLVNHVAKIFQVELATDDISFHIVRHASFDQCSIDLICCDPSRLTQIFINLISNAIKFTRNCKVREISLRYGASLDEPDIDSATMTGETLQWSPMSNSRQDPTSGIEWGNGKPIYVRFSVQDTGPGIGPQEVNQLFSRFSQASTRTHITYGGSGLGLYISRGLAERQGGKIGLFSTPNVGTTFAFYIKVRKSEVVVKGKDEISSNSRLVSVTTPEAGHQKTPKVDRKIALRTMVTGSTDSEGTAEKAKVSRFNILLVEDNLINQKILRQQLQRAGHTIYVANHGIEALDFLKTTASWIHTDKESSVRLDIILMDWEMPIMDGLTCSRLIRALELEGEIEHLPIIAITANTRSEQVQTALDAGIDDVLTKPFSVEDVTNKIRTWTGMVIGGQQI